MSKARFAQIVQDAIRELPEPFASHMEEVPIEIRARPTPKMLEEVGLEPDELLLGLYQGCPRTDRSVSDSGTMPDMILIFQEDLETVCDSEAELESEIRATVLHEIGHHFGMDEDDLDRLGYG